MFFRYFIIESNKGRTWLKNFSVIGVREWEKEGECTVYPESFVEIWSYVLVLLRFTNLLNKKFKKNLLGSVDAYLCCFIDFCLFIYSCIIFNQLHSPVNLFYISCLKLQRKWKGSERKTALVREVKEEPELYPTPAAVVNQRGPRTSFDALPLWVLAVSLTLTNSCSAKRIISRLKRSSHSLIPPFPFSRKPLQYDPSTSCAKRLWLKPSSRIRMAFLMCRAFGVWERWYVIYFYHAEGRCNCAMPYKNGEHWLRDGKNVFVCSLVTLFGMGWALKS